MLQWIKHLSRLCTFLSSLSIVLIDFYGLESFGFHFKHGKNAQKLFCDVASQVKEGLKCHLFVSLYNLEDMSVLGDHWYTQNIRILVDAPLACFVLFSIARALWSLASFISGATLTQHPDFLESYLPQDNDQGSTAWRSVRCTGDSFSAAQTISRPGASWRQDDGHISPDRNRTTSEK